MVVFANAGEGVLTGQEMIRGPVVFHRYGFGGIPDPAASDGSGPHERAGLVHLSGPRAFSIERRTPLRLVAARATAAATAAVLRAPPGSAPSNSSFQ
jgi:hypothetical protein